MKAAIALVALSILFSVTVCGQSIRFLEIVQKPSRTTAVEASLNERGGTISFSREYRSGCVGGYKVKLTFSTPLDRLQPGETFQATLNCEDCSTPCGFKWDIVDLQTSGSITGIDQYPQYIYNGNIELVSSSTGSSGVNDWDPGMRANVFTLKYEPKKDAPLTGIKILAAGDHEIFYVFETDDRTPASEAILASGIWSGWGTMTMNRVGAQVTGTYSDTYDSSDQGTISLNRSSNGVWTGAWKEPAIGREGELFDVTISSDGKTITGSYKVTKDGGKGNWTKNGSFRWTYKSPAVKP